MGVTDWEQARSAGRVGPLFETWVANEIRAVTWMHPERLELHYRRTHSGGEVDFILSKGERLLPLEVKAASSLTPRDLRGLERFIADHGKAAPFGCVIYTGSEHRLLGPRILAISAMAL